MCSGQCGRAQDGESESGRCILLFPTHSVTEGFKTSLPPLDLKMGSEFLKGRFGHLDSISNISISVVA